MNTIELEAQKACLAREILTINDENRIHSIWLLLKGNNPIPSPKKSFTKRKLGILNGKAKIEFRNDFEMTTEELLSMK
jgi:hypothetical protein